MTRTMMIASSLIELVWLCFDDFNVLTFTLLTLLWRKALLVTFRCSYVYCADICRLVVLDFLAT